MITILEKNSYDARKFFLENTSYVNFDLPEYFNFEPLLTAISDKIGRQRVNYFFAKDTNNKPVDPRDQYEVNKKIFGNKDGELAWRPFEIINPVLYVALVHLITEPSNWAAIVGRFKELKDNQIVVASIPTLRSKKKSAKAEQIRAWWEKFEQNCVAEGLRYAYVYETDVADCYSSIYTHAISWALYGKRESYRLRSDRSSLGNRIDELFQMMHHRQTNGIPQGSVLSDFIAELLLAYADSKLIKKLKSIDGVDRYDYKIIRYRDDYRIFTNKPNVGARILKELTEILADLGLKLNSSKTRRSDDIVLSSVKADKIDELFIPNIKREKDNYAKWLMQIYASTLKHPNSGKVSRQLSSFHQELLEYIDSGRSLRHYERADVMLSIVVNIAIKSPRYYNMAMAVASLMIKAAKDSKRGMFVERIVDKFSATPNTGLLDVWVQRLAYPILPNNTYNEQLTRIVNEDNYVDNGVVWNIKWLKPGMRELVRDTKVINERLLKKIREDQQIEITRGEIDLFMDIPS